MKKVQKLQTINYDDLIKETVSQEYPLGTELNLNETENGVIAQYMYVRAHAANSVIGTPYVIIESNNNNSEITTAVPFVGKNLTIGFTTQAVTENYYYWIKTAGIITSRAGLVAAGDYVKVWVSGTGLVVDGTTGSTTKTSQTIGIAKTGTSSSEIKVVVLADNQVEIKEETP
jgi:hypothetical protein